MKRKVIFLSTISINKGTVEITGSIQCIFNIILIHLSINNNNANYPNHVVTNAHYHAVIKGPLVKTTLEILYVMSNVNSVFSGSRIA